MLVVPPRTKNLKLIFLASISMSEELLFQPYQLGDLKLSTRVMMAPLTRMRAGPKEVASVMNAEYYHQRAAEGVLLIAEATQISRGAQAFPHTPGIFTREQAEGWRSVVEAVHAKKGYIFLQLWHVGRTSHSTFQVPEDFPDISAPVSSSAVGISRLGALRADTGEVVPFEVPRALSIDEIQRLVQFYKRGATFAHLAGFDGIEIHSANGYLLEQFLSDNVNRRQDQYGGSIENRSRIIFEVIDAVLQVFPPHRVGIRFSPWGSFNDINNSNPSQLYTYILQRLENYNLAYVHLIEPRVAGSNDTPLGPVSLPSKSVASIFRPFYRGTIIIAGGYKRENGIEIVKKGDADLVAYGRDFISNPDLPERLKLNLPLNKYDRKTFYTKGPVGYTDYPFYQRSNL